MKEINELPENLQMHIFKYASHPVVEIIDKEWNNLACTGYGETWDEFVKITLGEYKCKTRKRPLHCKAMKDAIRSYHGYLEWRKDNRTMIREPRKRFQMYTLDKTNPGCKCCKKWWRDCQCVCSDCGKALSICDCYCYDDL